MRLETKTARRKIGEKPQDIGLGNALVDTTPKAQATKTKASGLHPSENLTRTFVLVKRPLSCW